MPRSARTDDLLIGAHTPDAGGIHMAVRRAADAGMRALQVFTAVPKYYNERVGVKPDGVQKAGLSVRISGRAIHRLGWA